LGQDLKDTAEIPKCSINKMYLFIGLHTHAKVRVCTPPRAKKSSLVMLVGKGQVIGVRKTT
jgi:hypothetical protein